MLRPRRLCGRLLAILVGLPLAAANCDVLSSGCDPILRPGLRTTVVDSISGQPLSSDVVTVIAIDGVYADTGRVAEDGRSFVGVIDRPGRYRVEVRAPGYSTWVLENVLVEGPDECSNPVTELTARMQAAN
jgi:hypothetical protein